MTVSTRFGKKLPLPSTIDIRHELRLMGAADAILAAGALSPRQSEVMAGVIAARNGLTIDRVRMLIGRFALEQPAGAPRPTPAH